MIIGSGHLSLLTLIFALIGHGSGICDSPQSSVFFGLLCAFPSTILVEEALDRTGDTTRVYGRISRGLLFSCDLVAVVAFAFIFAFMEARAPDPVYHCHNATSLSAHNTSDNSTRRGGAADAGELLRRGGGGGGGVL
jgi:predicted Kef-type K+ transport protein